MCISADVLIQNISIGRAVHETISRVILLPYFEKYKHVQPILSVYVFTADGWMNLKIMFIMNSFVF